MKYLLISIFCLFSVIGFAQSTLPLRADTVLIKKDGGNGELKIENSTRDSLGVLVNTGGGKTQFRRVRVINDSTFIMPPNDTIIIRGGVSTGGGGGGSGTVNSGTQYQLAYYATNGTAISGLTLITASRALVSDANGLPVASTTSAAELDFLTGVTSSIQTQLNTKATNSQVSDSINTIRTARKWPAEERLGTIYDKQRWDNLQDFTPNAASGTVSLALSTNFVNYTVTTIDWNNYTRLLYTRPTILPNWTIEVIFKMNTAPSASTVGFGLGTKKYISQNADVMCYINTTNGGSSGNLNILRADGGATYGTPVATGAISQNDVVRLRVTFADSVVTFSALNLTTGSSGTMSYTSPLNSTPPLSAIANWGLIGHSTGSCTWQIQSIKITSETKRNANLVVVGDSKTQGAFANAFNNRYGTKLGIDYPSSYIYASGGATAADFLNLRDELMDLNGMQYFIHLGSNSIRGGTTVVNTIKDLRALVNWLKGGGATVRLGIAPEDSTGGGSGGGVGLTALKNAMVAEFPTEYFDIWTGMSTSNVLSATYNSGDGVHINQAGNDYIRNTIVSGAIFTTRPTNMIAPFRVTDGNVNIAGDSLSTIPMDKKLSYVPSWTIQGGLTTGILQDNGTNSGASATPLTPITGSVFNVTGMMSINGSAGSIVFGNQGSALSSGRYSLLASSNEFVLFDPVAGVNRMTVNSSGFLGLGTPSQDRKLDILDATNPQMRLTNVDGSVYTDFQTTSTGKHVINPTGALVEILGDIKATSTQASVVDSFVVQEDGVHKKAGIAAVLAALNIAAADFVPTLTGIANVDAVTLIDAHYMRIQDQVSFDVMLTIDPTAATTTTNVDVTLPIAATITNFTNLTGIITSGDGAIGNIVAAGNKARLGFISTSTASTTYNIHVSYKIP